MASPTPPTLGDLFLSESEIFLRHLAHGRLRADMEYDLTNDEKCGEYLKHCRNGELTTSWIGV